MLLIGYGNPGRGDDGLGPAFIEKVSARNLPHVACIVDYQLTVDHALAVAEARHVVFVDAIMGVETPYVFRKASAGSAQNLTSHSLTPAAVLTLAETLFGKVPEAHILGISGSEFGEVKEGLSKLALDHLVSAEAFFIDWHARLGAPEASLHA